MSSKACAETIEARLQVGQIALRRRRRIIGTECVIIGSLNFAIYSAVGFAYSDKHDFRGMINSKTSDIFELFAALVFNGRFLIWGIAPLSDDASFTAAILWIDILSVGILSVYSHLADDFPIVFATLNDLNSFLFICNAVWAIRLKLPGLMQNRMWNIIALNRLLAGLLHACALIYNLILEQSRSPEAKPSNLHHMLWFVGDACMHYVASRQKLIRRVQGWLLARIEAQCASAAAAGIAGLIGNCSVKEAIAQARSRFRCVPANELVLQDFFDSPASDMPVRIGLFERAQTCKLGSYDGCDVFLSHSWHDSAEAKWNALQRWRSAFVSQHGREPRIWFDKACIDQTDIEADLRGLPIFVSASKAFMVLCGPSYFSRLWCIVELFTFVHMGGSINQIIVLPVLRDGCEDAAAIKQAVQRFDAQQCTCFCQSDKNKMLEIIMAAYGDMASFNAAVRSLIMEAHVLFEEMS